MNSSPSGLQRSGGPVAGKRRAWVERSADRLIPGALKAHREQMQYLAVGGWNTVAGYGTFVILYHFLGDQLSYAVIILASYVVAIANAYLGYRYIAFRSHASVLREFPRFASVYVLTMIVNLVVFPLALHLLPLGALAVQGLFTVGVVVASYLGHKHYSFRRPAAPDPAVGAPGAGQGAGADGPRPGGE
jgi:putative flippase GtrA